MKKLFVNAGLLIWGFLIFSFNTEAPKDYSLAKVSKVSGKYIFMESEPMQEYEIVYELKCFVGGFNSPNDIVEYVDKLAKKQEKNIGKEYDALIIGSGKYDLAIKFKK